MMTMYHLSCNQALNNTAPQMVKETQRSPQIYRCPNCGHMISVITKKREEMSAAHAPSLRPDSADCRAGRRFRATGRLLALVVGLLGSGCGGSSPAGPSPVNPPTSTTVTLTGRLTATNGGQALPDVQAVLGATTATTDGSGSFSASGLPTTSATLSLTGSSIVPRTLQVAMLGTRDLAVDAIALGGQFDLNFYRQFVRDSTENANLQWIRRWTTSPNLYLQTGLADARTLELIERIARESVPQWTNNTLQIATVERGPDSRVGVAGWLTVLFSEDPRYCGLSDIGRSGGTITFYPKTATCGCDGSAIRARTIRHEFGHAMGFYHTDNPTDAMYRVASQCDMPLSARERYHAAIAYTRPVGNQDPDTDPTSSVSMAPMQKVQ
jgi:hypothetical protein